MSDQPLPPYDAIPAAWASLPPEIQAELGCTLIEYVFAGFVYGDMYGETNVYCTKAIRDEAYDRENKFLNSMPNRVMAILPDLFGEEPSPEHPEGGDPPWAWRDLNELVGLMADAEVKLLDLKEKVAKRICTTFPSSPRRGIFHDQTLCTWSQPAARPGAKRRDRLKHKNAR